MIVAIATEENMVAHHFGRCPEYTLFTLKDESIAEKKVIPNPGHEPGFLPGYLAEMGVNTVIAGGMGPRAQSLFDNQNIATYIGITGPLQSVIEAYLAGELKPGPSTCNHGQDGHSCG